MTRLQPLLLEGGSGRSAAVSQLGPEEKKMATGIRDKVAILGMGCSKFGERWEWAPKN